MSLVSHPDIAARIAAHYASLTPVERRLNGFAA